MKQIEIYVQRLTERGQLGLFIQFGSLVYGNPGRSLFTVNEGVTSVPRVNSPFTDRPRSSYEPLICFVAGELDDAASI